MSTIYRPTNSPATGDHGSEPVMDLQPGYGATASVSEIEESFNSGINSSYISLLIIWILLLALIAVAIYLVVVDRRKNNRKGQLQQQQQQDALETVMERTSTQCNWVAVSTILLGSCVGLALSIFSLVTCQFLDLDNEIEMDAYLDDNNVDGRESINIYSLGLWSVDMSISYPRNSRCFNADGLAFLDWIYKLARASSVISTVLGGACLLLLFICAMKPKFLEHIHQLAWPFLLAAVFQFMTLTLFNSVYCTYDFEGGSNCRASFGVITSITAALYWTFGATAAAFLPFNKKQLRQLC